MMFTLHFFIIWNAFVLMTICYIDSDLLSCPYQNVTCVPRLQPVVDWQLLLIHPSISFIEEEIFFVKIDETLFQLTYFLYLY